MSIESNLELIRSGIPGNVTLVAVSKTKPSNLILEAYNAGQRHFGENKVQEMVAKQLELPGDIHWHLLGHLQTNKVKYIIPFVHLIHSCDSEKILKEINRQAKKEGRKINCLIQVHIAMEETKFGMSLEEAEAFFRTGRFNEFEQISFSGLMGMASNVEDDEQVRKEFRQLKKLFDKIVAAWYPLTVLSMGMSHDHKIAIEEGSTMIRVGSAIFGER